MGPPAPFRRRRHAESGRRSSARRAGRAVRTLVIGEVHGNLPALEAVLAEPHDLVLCLGDLVGFGPEPAERVGRVRDLARIVVQGDHDRRAALGIPTADRGLLQAAIGATRVVSPGSVGLPLDGDPRAAYAVLDGDQVWLRRVPYPIERTIAAVRRAGLPASVRRALERVLWSGAASLNEPLAGARS